MTTEEIVKQLKEIGTKAEALQEGFDEKLEKASEEWATSARDEQKKITDEIKTDFSAQVDLIKKLQDHADELDVKLQKAAPGKSKHRLIQIQEILKSNEKFTKRDSRFSISMPDIAKVMEIKQDDMIGSNTLTGAVIHPDQVPGIFYDPDTMFRVRNLMPVGTTTSNSVKVVRESAYSDNTDITFEGSEYKQGDFDLTLYSAEVFKITGYMIVSEEMLEDVDGLSSYIYTRLPSKVSLKENQQLLYGTGSAQISGLSVNATAYSDNLADSNVTLIDILADSVRQIVVEEYFPSAIILHPADAMKYLKLTKDSTGRYLGPWVFTDTGIAIAGVPVIESTSITEDSFFVGDFRRAAQVFDRRQNNVEITNLNEDNFIKGMMTVRASERIALAIYRPTSFLLGSISVALANGSG